MALLPSSVDYTDRDFDALRARLRNLASIVFPEWTDDDSANFGNVLLELFSHAVDVVGYYQDNQAREAFWPTAQQRSSLLALAKMINYVPAGNTAAQVDVEVRLQRPATARVVIPARSRVRTDSIVAPVFYETLTDVVFTAGSAGPVVVTAENSEVMEEFFSPIGLPNYEVQLEGRPFIDGSLEVNAPVGDYVVVESFLESTAVDLHCTVVVNEAQRATVRFGNGINGVIPTGTVSVVYKVGGGSAGRVEANTLKRLDDPFTDETGAPVQVLVNNPASSTPAQDRKTIEQMRVEGPKTIRVQERTVSREDYEINAGRVAGVARALHLTSDQYAGIEENTGQLFIVPTGGGVPTQALRDAVHVMVTKTYPNTTTFVLNVMSPLYRPVDVQTTVYLREGAKRDVVRALIQVAMVKAFAIDGEGGAPNPVIDFGYNLRDTDGTATPRLAWSDIFDLVRNVSGVKRVDASAAGLLLNGDRSDVELLPLEFPTLGAVVVYDGASGTVIPLDEVLYETLGAGT